MDAWLDTLPTDERAELIRTWELTALTAPEASEDTADAAVAQFASRLAEEGILEVSSATSRPSPRRDRPPVASARVRGRLRRAWTVVPTLAALIAVGLLVWLRPTVVEVPSGSVKTKTLPDGSVVTLNGGSWLSFRRGLQGAARRVHLEGEVFFEVAHDGRPFVIETANAEVRVLGTRFAVRAWNDAEWSRTTVTLEEGAVELAARANPERAVRLHPGEASRVVGTDDVTEPEPVSLDVALAWQTGGIALLDEPVGAVFAEMKRRFDVQVATPSDSLRRVPVMLYLPVAGRPEDVLDALCIALTCRYERVPGGFVVHPDGRQ